MQPYLDLSSHLLWIPYGVSIWPLAGTVRTVDGLILRPCCRSRSNTQSSLSSCSSNVWEYTSKGQRRRTDLQDVLASGVGKFWVYCRAQKACRWTRTCISQTVLWNLHLVSILFIHGYLMISWKGIKGREPSRAMESIHGLVDSWDGICIFSSFSFSLQYM